MIRKYAIVNKLVTAINLYRRELLATGDSIVKSQLDSTHDISITILDNPGQHVAQSVECDISP